jgi:hypothetical protein
MNAGNATAQTLAAFLDEHPRQVLDVADTAERLRTLGVRLRSIFHQWKTGHVSEDLLRILNITLPCGNNCPISRLTPARCGHDFHQRKLLFFFTGDLINQQELLLTADPFTLFQFHEQQRCEMIYVGDRSVLFNRQSQQNCSVRILHSTDLTLNNPNPCGLRTPVLYSLVHPQSY